MEQQSNGNNQIRQRSLQQQQQHLVENKDDDATPPVLSDDCNQKSQRFPQKTTAKKPEKKSFRICKMLFLILFFLAVIFTAVIPLLFRFSSLIQRGTVFMNIVNFSLRTPEDVGLQCTRNWKLKLTVPSKSTGKEADIRLGVWHISPREAQCSVEGRSQVEHPKLKDGRLVVLYTHGMGGTRSSAHRVALYKMLSNQLNAHVIAFDYRGYGDSSFEQWPTADRLANDTMAIYNWLTQVEQVPSSRILLWGHSLGTAVAIRFLSILEHHSVPSGPMAAVLESPFTSLREAIPVFPLAKLFSLLPHFDYCFLQPLVSDPRLNFDSASLMADVKTPLLFLHALDDKIVPYSLGKKLYDIALQEQPKSVRLRAQLYSFPADKAFGHKNIVAAAELPEVVQKFIETVQKS